MALEHRAAGGDVSGTADNGIEVSIVMPCLNEAESLGRCIEMAREGLSGAGVEGEIVIADNGSEDGSQEIAAGGPVLQGHRRSNETR